MTMDRMLIILDANGEVAAAQVEQPPSDGVVSYITPATPLQTMHRIDVPEEISKLADPISFQRAINEHVRSNPARLQRISAEELQSAFAPGKQARSQNMIVVLDKDGGVVAAQLEAEPGSEIVSFISPAGVDHTLHRIIDVPARICSLDDPIQFEKAITAHIGSDLARITHISVEELHATIASYKG